MILAFNKPYGVLSQFTPESGSQWDTLSSFGLPGGVWPIGRLDADSEGLLLLSDEARWNAALLNPGRHVEKTYWALVERVPSDAALGALRSGVVIGGHRTMPAGVDILNPQPIVAARVPPVRYRASVQDVWIRLVIAEGKNRQVRKMTASVGHPTLRLLRVAIGGLELAELALEPGEFCELGTALTRRLVRR